MRISEQTVLPAKAPEANSLPTLKCLVTDRLIAGGFGGLFNEWGDCACRLGELFPCGAPSEDCTAGYVHEVAPGWDGFVVNASRTPRGKDPQGSVNPAGTHDEDTE